MSDPSERNRVNHHPVSSHRTPSEIAEDEAGPIGGHQYEHDAARANNGPVEKLTEPTETNPVPRRGQPDIKPTGQKSE